MRKIELQIGELVGYSLGGPEANQITKLGSAKIGDKVWSTECPDEPQDVSTPVKVRV
jgi:hypothetical protein